MNFDLKELAKLEHPRQLACARLSPCGAILAAGGFDARLHRWRVGESALEPLPSLGGHDGWVAAVGFSATRLFSADSWGRLRCQGFEGEAPEILWDLAPAHDGWIRSLAVGSRHLATCGRDRAVRIWTHDGKPVAEWKGGEDLFAAAWHPEEKLLAFGDLKGAIRLWDFAAGRVVREFDAGVFYKLDRVQDLDGLRRLLFLEGGKTLVAAGSAPANGATYQGTPTLKFFDVGSGEARGQIQHGEVKDGHVEDLAAHPAGYLMAVSSGGPGNGRIFCLRPGEEKPFFSHTKLPNCHVVTLHPDGRRVVATSTNRDSNGNGRPPSKDGKYVGNRSLIHLFEVPPV